VLPVTDVPLGALQRRRNPVFWRRILCETPMAR